MNTKELTITPLSLKDARKLYRFYTAYLTEREREMFNPYPLFDSSPSSPQELSDRIKSWQQEDDWVVLLLKRKREIIGMGLLKRYKTERPVNGFAISMDYRNLGLATLLLENINGRARALGLKGVYASIAQDNRASLRVHEKCGYKPTGQLIPHYAYKNKEKIIDRYDIAMVRDI